MEYILPELGEGVYEAELVEWRVGVGDTVRRGQTLAEVLTDKATMELPAGFSGTIEALLAEPGDQVQVGRPIVAYAGGSVAEDAGAAEPIGAVAGQTTATEQSAAAAVTNRPAVKAAPAVRRRARELGIDLGEVRGSGPKGRLLLEDIDALAEGAAAAVPSHKKNPSPPVTPRVSDNAPAERIPLRGIRRKIAEHMVHAKRMIPHYSYVDECDVTDLVKLRESLKPVCAAEQIRLTYLPFIAKAAVRALQQYPIVNASLDDEAQEIVVHSQYDLGIATDTPQGLMVPVVRGIDRLSWREVAAEIQRLAGLARAGELAAEDLRGGTFTLTSIGGIGGLISTPIVNHPQVGILGVGKIVKRPMFDEHDNIRPAHMVYLSFSFDHRVVDGAVGAAFGNAVIQGLRQPATLLV